MAKTILKFEIPINPVTKKNHNQLIMVKGHPVVLPSKPYQEYEKLCKRFIPPLKSPIDTSISLKCTYYMKTRRKCDITNLLQATCDMLVKYNVISDDNYSIINNFDGTRVFYDKDHPRTIIEIIEV